MVQFKSLINQELEDWIEIQAYDCQVPNNNFVYKPRECNYFAYNGEARVLTLLRMGKPVYRIFNKIVNLNVQRETAISCFERLKGTQNNQPGAVGTEGYFRTSRSYSNLVPFEYVRTPESPRLTVQGDTFHGMDHFLFSEIVKELTLLNKSMMVAEIDMSACHSRIAASLAPKGNILDVALMEPNFWDSQVQDFMPLYFNKGIEINKKVLKRLLKTALYTSLNGGNPASEARIIANLTDNALDLLPNNNLTSSDIFSLTKDMMSSLKWVNEVKDLIETCVKPAIIGSDIYTIDRWLPYKNDNFDTGISRVLQSFEVVLLSHLTLDVVRLKGVPLSLDHDNIKVAFFVDNHINMDDQLAHESVQFIEETLSKKLTRISRHLMKRTVPIEVQRLWCHGKVQEFESFRSFFQLYKNHLFTVTDTT